jgi:methyltransferase (TIGR00027 family)
MSTEVREVALTAFYCCALRAQDAANPSPVCGDTFAVRFLDDDVRARIAPLLAFRGPGASNIARHRLIDDLLRDALRADSSRRILVLGAGFDTRAFRLAGGRWWEFDDPALFALKEARLPERSAPNPLSRQPIDFRRERLADRLAPFAGNDPAMVVLEGVSMYLPPDALQTLARTVRGFLPRARFVADLMTAKFRRRFGAGLARELRRLGANFADADAHPQAAIEGAGYRLIASSSIVERARQAGIFPIPRFLLNTLLREARDGYQVCLFEAAPNEGEAS